jgi:phage terminase large subunit
MDVTIEMNKIYVPYLGNDKRYEIFYGGAGSGKSRFVAQKKIIQHMRDRGRKTLVVRKVGRTIRESAFAELKTVIYQYDLSPYFRVPRGKTDFDILGPNDNQFVFTGLDDVEKLKSIVGITDVWIEEASEITEEDFNQLDLRLRGKTAYPKQITLTFNPISALSWLKRRFFDQPDDKTSTLKTTYKDNRFLDDEYIQVLESLKDKDYTYYQIYTLGNWGVLGNLVYGNYVVEDFPQDDGSYSSVYAGVDFGFNDPSAIIKIGWKDDELYILDELYRKGMTNAELIQEIEDSGVITRGHHLVADSAEPDRIKEFRTRGYDIHPAEKGKDSVRFGIDWIKRHKIHIHPRCQNFVNEIQSYKYREDKDGNVLEEPVDMNNHLMDAMRYALEPLIKQRPLNLKMDLDFGRRESPWRLR